jgi:hypothetical protein
MSVDGKCTRWRPTNATKLPSPSRHQAARLFHAENRATNRQPLFHVSPGLEKRNGNICKADLPSPAVVTDRCDPIALRRALLEPNPGITLWGLRYLETIRCGTLFSLSS